MARRLARPHAPRRGVPGPDYPDVPHRYRVLRHPVPRGRRTARAVDTARGEIPTFDLDALDHLEDFADISDYNTIHPFIPFAYQVQGMQIFDHVVLGKYRAQMLNVIWDKARGVGFTYAMLAAAYKTWLLRKNIRGTILTEKWDKADRTHSLNTLFGKLDLFFDSTPDWLIPPGFKAKGDKEAHRLKGTLFNPQTGSIIETEPTTVSSTRSGRSAYVMIDEGAFQAGSTSSGRPPSAPPITSWHGPRRPGRRDCSGRARSTPPAPTPAAR